VLDFQTLAQRLPASFGTLYIAYSGGIDSHVLLHWLAQTPWRDRLIAVYVDHGLQAASTLWGEHGRQQAQALGVPFRSLTVNARALPGESPEAAARNARYAALEPLLQTGDLLATAQHREDQMETVLLQLFRGAGISGLAAMPFSTAFGKGHLIRPLLDVSKSAIETYAAQQGLSWIEDPTNHESDFDRNFLRNEIIPFLKQRWPSLDKTIARSARHCGEAATLLNAWSQDALSTMQATRDNSLALDAIARFTPEQGHWLIRHWLQNLGLKPPTQAQLQTIYQQALNAQATAAPEIILQGRVLKRYRQHLYCLQPQQWAPFVGEYHWPAEQPRLALANGAVVTRQLACSGIACTLWHTNRITLKARRGGETLKLPNRTGHHDLKKLFQEAGIPPWEREVRPLLYLNDRLAAVPGLWIADWAWGMTADARYALTWQASQSM